MEFDILKVSPQFAKRFDFVRAANILNLHYFSGEQLKVAVQNIKSYLRGRGSLLLVARTAEGGAENAASLFELLDSGKFAEIARYGKGSEVRDLVLQA
jgi:hypothetical protein